GAQELDDVERVRPSLVLIFLGGHDAERLTNVLLVDTDDVVALGQPVVTLDDDGDLILEPHDFRLRGGQTQVSREHKADMLVLGMAVELTGRRLENMRRGQAPAGNAAAIVLLKQGGLGLGAGKAELSGIARKPPRGVIFAQDLETLGDVGFVEPFDVVFLAAPYGVEALRRYKLDRACAIFADVGN